MDKRDVVDILKDNRCVEGKGRKRPTYFKWKAYLINRKYKRK
jgi:hypothetical protein